MEGPRPRRVYTIVCRCRVHHQLSLEAILPGSKNQRLGSFFSVYIATSADLKKAIFKELPRDGWKQVTGSNATDLGLWKLSNPISTEKDAIYYQTAFASLDFSNPEWDDENPDDTSEVRLLNPLYEISERWDE